MFTELALFKYCRFYNSAMLLDFFFKKIIYYFLKKKFLICNIIFSEKFFIENLFLKIANSITLLYYLTNKSTNNFTYSYLSFILLLLVLFSFIIL